MSGLVTTWEGVGEDVFALVWMELRVLRCSSAFVLFLFEPCISCTILRSGVRGCLVSSWFLLSAFEPLL